MPNTEAPEPRPGHVRTAHAAMVAHGPDGDSGPVVFFYREDRPYQILLRADPKSDEKDWRFARSILAEALAFQVPDPIDRMEVTAERHGANGRKFVLTLASGRPQACPLTFSTDEIRDFLRMTYALVPIGGESAAIDWAEVESDLGLAPGQLTGGPA